MADETDIKSDIALELGGNVSPDQIADALKAFTALLDHSHKQAGSDESIKWTVQLKEGSNLVEYSSAPDTPINPTAIDNLQKGIAAFESGTNQPSDFNEEMVEALHELCNIPGRKTYVRIRLNKTSSDIGAIKNNVMRSPNSQLTGAFEEGGAVEGELQMLNAHNDKREFAIYEPLHSRKIICIADNDEIFAEAYQLFGQRAEVEGLVKYGPEGLPRRIKAKHLRKIDEPDAGDWRSTKGILAKYA